MAKIQIQRAFVKMPLNPMISLSDYIVITWKYQDAILGALNPLREEWPLWGDRGDA